jgi:hypothetical protein
LVLRLRRRGRGVGGWAVGVLWTSLTPRNPSPRIPHPFSNRALDHPAHLPLMTPPPAPPPQYLPNENLLLTKEQLLDRCAPLGP